MVLEIRVHGVANTSPQSMLQEFGLPGSDIDLVDGDDTTGFWARRDESRKDPPPLRRLAYSWGQLTAGARLGRKDVIRAAWTMLAPFALANVALWTVEGELPANSTVAPARVVTNRPRHFLVRAM